MGDWVRLGEIHPAVSETVVHGESYLMTGGTLAVIAIARLIIATVLLTVRVELKALFLLVLIRCCLRWCWRLQVDRDRSRLRSNDDEDIKWRPCYERKKHHFGPWWARKGPPEGKRVSWEEFGSLWGPDGHNKQKGPNRQIARFLLGKWQFWCFHDVFTKREKKNRGRRVSPMSVLPGQGYDL